MPQSSTSSEITITFLDGSQTSFTAQESKTLCAGRIVQFTDAKGDTLSVNVAAIQTIRSTAGANA